MDIFNLWVKPLCLFGLMTAICGMCPWHVCASWQSFLCIFYATFLFISLLRYFCFVFHSTFFPPTVLTKWWMKEYELWMLNGVNGQKKKNNGKCWTKTWTVDGIQVIRSGSGGSGVTVDSQGPKYECEWTSELRLLLFTAYHLSLGHAPFSVWAHSNDFWTVLHLQCITQTRSCII